MNDVIRPRNDRILLMSFDSSAEVLAELTNNMEALEKGVNGMRPAGGTSLYDAIYMGAERLTREQPREKFRRALIVITDGEDTQSRYTRD